MGSSSRPRDSQGDMLHDCRRGHDMARLIFLSGGLFGRVKTASPAISVINRPRPSRLRLGSSKRDQHASTEGWHCSFEPHEAMRCVHPPLRATAKGWGHPRPSSRPPRPARPGLFSLVGGFTPKSVFLLSCCGAWTWQRLSPVAVGGSWRAHGMSRQRND